MIVASKQAIVRAGINNFGILGIGRQPAAFASADVVPIAHADAAIIAARCDAHGAIVLLRAVGVIRKIVVECDTVELGGGLLILTGPGASAVGADVGAAVVAFDHAVGIIGGDPKIVNVAVRGANGVEGFAAIVGPVEAGVDGKDGVWFQRIGEDARVVPGALAELAILIHAAPGFACVVRAKHAAIFGFDERPDAIGIRWRDGDADAAEDAFGQSRISAEIGPGVAAVGGFEQAAIGAATFQIPRDAMHIPEGGVDNIRISGIENQIHRAGLYAACINLFPCFTTVGGAENAALFVRSPEMAHGRDVDDVGILGVHANRADLERVIQTKVLPGFARVVRFINAVAMRGIAADIGLTHADVDNVGVGFRDADGADGSGFELAVRDWQPA